MTDGAEHKALRDNGLRGEVRDNGDVIGELRHIEYFYKGIPEGRLIYCRKDLNYWLEYKEAFVIRRWFQRISDTNLFPVLIIDQINKGDTLDHPSIRYYLLELEAYPLNYGYRDDGYRESYRDDDGYRDEARMNELEAMGFIHICYSKDDLPIFLYQNKII